MSRVWNFIMVFRRPPFIRPVSIRMVFISRATWSYGHSIILIAVFHHNDVDYTNMKG